MKRRLSVLFAVVVFALTLTACGAISETEEAISAIGTVTMESLDEIQHAEALFDSLKEIQQDHVENADELKAARREYNRLEQLIEDMGDVLQGIETVTPESGDDIEEAWELYEELQENDLTDYVEDAEKLLKAAQKSYDRQCKLIEDYEKAMDAIGTVTLGSKGAIERAEKAYTELLREHLDHYVSNEELIAAREEYEELYLLNWCEEIIELYGEGKYSAASAEIQRLENKYPNHAYSNEMSLLNAYCHIALAEIAFSEDRLEDAAYELDLAESRGSGTQEYMDLRTKVDNKIASNRPNNGEILYNRIGTGYGKLTVKAGSTDVCVKLESVDDPDKYILFYVHANSEAKISVSSGEYIFKYTYGQTWFSDTEMFGTYGGYSQSDETLTFTVSYSGNYVYYRNMTITLYDVIGGNFDTEDIDAGDF